MSNEGTGSGTVGQAESQKQSELHRELSRILNKYSQENASNTPDFILADYLLSCLETWNWAIGEREKWHGRATGR